MRKPACCGFSILKFMEFKTEYFSDIIESAIKRIDYPAEPRGLYEPIRYTLEGGGKRLRPVLLLAAAAAYGLTPEKAVTQALGIEMFHNFTLLHDDVMDKADVRRGRPTVHRRWNEATAILSGDAMVTMATQFMTRSSVRLLPGVMYMFNRTAMEIYEGQQYDLDFESRKDVTEEEYIEMIRLKTSVLLACACYLGALLACAPEQDQKALYRYGEKLGLAFQLRDDYLDTYGDPALFGKAIGGDIINEKKTWLWIMASQRDPKALKEILDQRLSDHLKVEAVKELYNRLGLPEASQALIDKYVEEALAALPESLPHEAAQFFRSLAQKLSSRES